MAGRPAAPIYRPITNNVLLGNTIENLVCIQRGIYDSMNDQIELLTWLAERHLILNSNDCQNWFVVLNLLMLTT